MAAITVGDAIPPPPPPPPPPPSVDDDEAIGANVTGGVGVAAAAEVAGEGTDVEPVMDVGGWLAWSPELDVASLLLLLLAGADVGIAIGTTEAPPA